MVTLTVFVVIFHDFAGIFDCVVVVLAFLGVILQVFYAEYEFLS